MDVVRVDVNKKFSEELMISSFPQGLHSIQQHYKYYGVTIIIRFTSGSQKIRFPILLPPNNFTY
jgi:hypothetical protein